jgi:hypothetical protein
MMRTQVRAMALLAAGFVVFFSGRAAAQAPLAATDAAGFLGAWSLGLETPQGALTLDLTLKDDGGKVSGSISAAPLMPEPQAITDISKDGGSLVLKYMLDFQGTPVPAKISLVPDGDKWKANFDFADGQFVMDGSATKK